VSLVVLVVFVAMVVRSVLKKTLFIPFFATAYERHYLFSSTFCLSEAKSGSVVISPPSFIARCGLY
jgi:hypothetical protein